MLCASEFAASRKTARNWPKPRGGCIPSGVGTGSARFTIVVYFAMSSNSLVAAAWISVGVMSQKWVVIPHS